MARGRKSRSYHHGDLRAALLDAAVELVAERGLQGLSLRECARRVGVSHAAPYRHFEDKNGLVLAIAAQGFEWLRQAGVAAMEGLDDPRARLDAYGVAYVRFAIEHPVHHRVMFTSEVEEPSDQNTDVGGGAFTLLVESAAAVVGPEEDAMAAAIAAWSLPHGLAMLMLDGRIPEEHIATPEAAEALARTVFAMWRGPLGS